MKLIINTAHQRFGGAVQGALSFLYECINHPEHEYYVWVGPGVAKSLKEEDFPANFSFQRVEFGPVNLLKAFRINRVLRRYEKQIDPDCIIATSGPTYFHARAPQVIGYTLPLYIYPESPYLQDLSVHRAVRFWLKKRLHFYFFRRDADAYVVQTGDVNRRVRKALGTSRVHTVTNTFNGFYRDWQQFPDKLPPRKTGEFRFLTLSSWYLHKNLELIPEVLSELTRRGYDQVRFVVTLDEQSFSEHIRGEQHSGILNVGPVKPRECPSLYQECDAMFLPTLAECFSASYPEAMIMGKPIVTTDLGFARSICGDAALFYEAKNAKAAAEVIIRLLENEPLQKDLIEQGRIQLNQFDTPSERARKYLEICSNFSGA